MDNNFQVNPNSELTDEEVSVQSEESRESAEDLNELQEDVLQTETNASADTGECTGAPTCGINPYTGVPYDQMMQSSKAKKKARTAGGKRPGGFFRKAATAVALALIFGVVSGAVILGMTGGLRDSVGAGQQMNDPSISTDGKNPGDGKKPSNGKIQSAADAMKDALERAEISAKDTFTIPQIHIIMEPVMVSIECIGETIVDSFFGQQAYQTSSSGSGIIVGENDTELLIVTNNHVIDNANSITVQFVDGSESNALVKGTDPINDLAIIVVRLEEIPDDTIGAIAYAEIGDSDALVIGEGVVAIGNALGFGQSVTAGIVSALDRAVTDSNGNTTYLIQTDAAINPGNSGGALVNMRGELIGINSAKYSDEAVEGMCFAIPISTAMPILEELMELTTRVEITDPEKAAYLGISPGQDITAQISQAYNMSIGLYVSEVLEGGPAAEAGMYKADIITKFDREIITGINSLRKALSYYEAGETVEVTVARMERGEYREIVLTIKLANVPKE